MNLLAGRLRAALVLNPGTKDLGWAPNTQPMRHALKEVQQTFGGDDDRARPPRDDMVVAVRKFMRKRQVESFTQLKYVCYGVTVSVDDDGDRLIDQSALLQRLLDLVKERQGQAKQFRRCYQGLLAAYFGFEREGDGLADARRNWLGLRGYLDEHLLPVAKAASSRGRSPGWLEVLLAHRNLLGDSPCNRYAKSLRAGDRSELEAVCAGLDIAPTSWVWHEAVMAYVNEVIRVDDPPFQAEMPQLLAVVHGDQHGHQLPSMVAREAMALTVARYARCRDKPEHAGLRDACLHRIGNPWLERTAWDASVKSETARQMVESWLKRRLIADFFSLLAQDGSADVRRLQYWLKWEPLISDMWFVLGTDAMSNRSALFVDVRRRMEGRLRALTGYPERANNAFVMCIGHLLVIEFGKTGNACYVFDRQDFKTDLDQESLGIAQLKQTLQAERLTHAGPWESKFEIELQRRLGRPAPVHQRPPAAELPVRTSVPRTQTPTQSLVESDPLKRASLLKGIWPEFTPPKDDTPEPRRVKSDGRVLPREPLNRVRLEKLEWLCQDAGLAMEDNRKKGGALWVRMLKPEDHPGLRVMLERWSFRYVAGKGYYREADD
ncbi:EH signature domain-containing protein [Pseudaquabacterium pictum]|uniref:Zorya protein ZorC EH domain-containing protein n=1 Tax=Pseudaquabacterium pictum TaxID=2315236 RepID=A0A480AW87_9BURK|nr:EH signature domain-containing protein [Rubrivivax pictus]GCL65156.1 hypothetical protein AQPW35_42370 [Rubrivivax pictus]